MKTLKLYFFTASLLVLSSIANAQIDHYWTGAVDNNWSESGNWADAAGTPLGSIPGEFDNVFFDPNVFGFTNADCIISGTAEASVIEILNSFPGLITLDASSTLSCIGFTITSFSGEIRTLSGSLLFVGGSFSNTASSITMTLEGSFSVGTFAFTTGILDATSCPKFYCSFQNGGNGGFNISGCDFAAPQDSLIIELSLGNFTNRTAGSFI